MPVRSVYYLTVVISSGESSERRNVAASGPRRGISQGRAWRDGKGVGLVGALAFAGEDEPLDQDDGELLLGLAAELMFEGKTISEALLSFPVHAACPASRCAFRKRAKDSSIEDQPTVRAKIR
jgi:hypothetical protein